MTAAPISPDSPPARPGRVATSGALLGIGVAAFVDEAVFHQLLHWHHFYDGATTEIGLVSDGVFHAFGFFATVAGLFLLADLRRRAAFEPWRWWGALLVAAGAFQVYDGVVHHKVMGVHQVRYGVDLLPYDVAWLGSGAALMVVGAVLLQRARRVPTS